MKQNVNYIDHHRAVNYRMSEDSLTSIHISLYNALFLIWNECGFDTELSINRNDVMKLSKIGSANTYTKALKELDEKGYLTYKPSHNPLVGSRINLYRFDNSSDKSTNKSSSKGTDKSSDKTSDKSSDTLSKQGNYETTKQLNYETITETDFIEEKIEFDFFWNLYDKKVGDLKKCKKKWDGFDFEKQSKILHHVEQYVIHTPDKKYRANPETYFNQERWTNEIINQSNESNKKTNRGATPEELRAILIKHSTGR